MMDTPSENDQRIIRTALENHAAELKTKAKSVRKLGHDGMATNLESEADDVRARIAVMFGAEPPLAGPPVEDPRQSKLELETPKLEAPEPAGVS